jgi:hypothetical protein
MSLLSALRISTQHQKTSDPARQHTRWLGLLTLSIPAVYALILTVCASRVGTSDYDQFLVFHELQYWNTMLFGLAKQWTPVMCSGLSMAGEPQVPFASLTMLAGYVFGPLAGIVVGNVAFLAIGWIGAFLYSGLWSRQPGLRPLAASLFIGNGFFICRFAHGHDDFVPFLALPLALWVIHRFTSRKEPAPKAVGHIQAVLLLGCLFAVVIDGSPVAIIHWLLWIGLYAAVLSWMRQSALPVCAYITACAIAAVLDAGYLWPMIDAQSGFPRHTPDTFTGPWSLPWFMLLPMRGKVLPANGTGIELSVFIGPFLFYLIWRFRTTLRREMPRELQVPLLVVSLICIWLGMGSLRVAHLPVWISPFDWLRSLPGFRSIGVTGRFWGFLALPLSLLAAAALWRYAATEPPSRRKALLLAAVFLTQLGFQSESLLAAWWPSYVYEQISLRGIFTGAPERIEAVQNPNTAANPRFQGELITPVRAVTNCYDMDDFEHASVHGGTNLIKDIRADASGATPAAPLQAGFVTWNRIRIGSPAPTIRASTASVLRIELNQAYHARWTSAHCTLTRGDQGNLVASCPVEDLRSGPVDLVFFDPISDLGMRVSVRAATVLGPAMLMLALLNAIPKRREAAVTSGAG